VSILSFAIISVVMLNAIVQSVSTPSEGYVEQKELYDVLALNLWGDTICSYVRQCLILMIPSHN
jgi:hypothetical protein